MRRFWKSPSDRAPDVHAEVREELEGHLALRVRDNLARGLTPREAQDEAARRLGPLDDTMTQSTEIRRRSYAFRRMLGHDFRQAWIAVVRRPGLTIAGVLVAAIGLTTAFASARVADALMVRAPVGVRNADRLQSVRDAFDGEHATLMSYAVFAALESGAGDLRPFAWTRRTFQIRHDEGSGVWNGALVSGWYFDALGTRARAGRLLSQADDAAAAPVAVVSLPFARRLSPSAAAAAVGRVVMIRGIAFTVVGVAERGFRGLEAGHPVDLWLPLSTEPDVSTPNVFPDGSIVRGFRNTPGIGFLRGGLRLTPDATAEAAAQRLTALTAQIPDGRPRPPEARIALDPQPWLSPFSGDRESLAAVLEPIIWAVGLTLALTGACLSGLVAGRLSDRRREFGIRMALGAGTARLRRQSAIELGLVVLAGAAIAAAGSEALIALAGRLRLTPGITVGDALAPFDVRAALLLLFGAVAIAVVAGVTSLTMVARMAATAMPAASPGRTTTAGTRLRRALIAAQVAAGCALLGGAGLLTRSIDALQAQPVGFDAGAVAFVQLNPAGDGLTGIERATLLDRIVAQDGVPAPALAAIDEVTFTNSTTLFVFAEGSEESRAFPLWTSRIAGPYFETLGVRPLAGRPFVPADTTRPVAIVSAALAELYWPGENALGRFVRIGGPNGERREIVGVVPGLRDRSLRGDPVPRVYLPYDHDAEGLALVARAGPAGPAALVPELVRAVRQTDPRLVPVQVGSLGQLAARTIEQRVLFRLITGIIGLGSLLMVGVGVWGLTHSSLRRRWREFGIRQALGARRSDVARRALADAWVVGLIGGSIGLLGAWQFGRVLESWLFGVDQYDPASLASSVGFVLLAVFAGAMLPARQAGRIDPAELLRSE